MYVVRDVFNCKPGQSKSVADKFNNSIKLMQNMEGFISARVLVDYVANYWTVVLESEVENLADFERNMSEYAARDEFREALNGYMEQINGGYREIFRIL